MLLKHEFSLNYGISETMSHRFAPATAFDTISKLDFPLCSSPPLLKPFSQCILVHCTLETEMENVNMELNAIKM